MELIISRLEHKAGSGGYFKTMDTAFFEDAKISSTACNLLACILCKPDEGWELAYPYLLRVFKECLDTIENASRELAKAGYLLKVFKHGPWEPGALKYRFQY